MNKIMKAFVAAMVLTSGIVVGAGQSLATVDDPTGGMTTSVQTGVEGWVAEYGVPMLGALLILGLIIGIGIRFSKRGARAVSGG